VQGHDGGVYGGPGDVLGEVSVKVPRSSLCTRVRCAELTFSKAKAQHNKPWRLLTQNADPILFQLVSGSRFVPRALSLGLGLAIHFEMMFKTGNACAVAGAVLVATAASLYSASLGMQHVATAKSATSATSDGNATCEIATLGVFRSSYMPECAGLPGTAMTVDTLQFWPLFPAQNRFGQVSEVAAFGVGSTPFTNCDDYISLTAAQLQAGGVAEISQGFAAMVAEAFSELNAQLGAVKMVLPMLGIKDGMSEADWANVADLGNLADMLLPGAGKFIQLLTQLCAPPATQTLAFCAQSLQDALSAPIDTETKTFQSPIGAVFDSYFNMTSTVVQILTSPGLALLNITLPASIVKQLVQANDLVHGCSAAAATNAKQCALLAEVPDDGFASNYPLAPTLSATHSLGSFFDFAKAYVLSQPKRDELEIVYVSLIAAATARSTATPTQSTAPA
jgi:hypothetical protein